VEVLIEFFWRWVGLKYLGSPSIYLVPERPHGGETTPLEDDAKGPGLKGVLSGYTPFG
jgi:hypothetical protein